MHVTTITVDDGYVIKQGGVDLDRPVGSSTVSSSAGRGTPIHGDEMIHGDVDIIAYKCSSELSVPVTCPPACNPSSPSAWLLVAESLLAVGAREFIIGPCHVLVHCSYNTNSRAISI